MNSYNGFSGTERMAADKILKHLILSGKLVNPGKCEICGKQTKSLMNHLEDYSKIETSKWLCVYCHMTLHSRFRRPNYWKELCLTVRKGLPVPYYETVGQWFNSFKNVTDKQEFKLSPNERWWEQLSFTPINLRATLFDGK
jgi:hypothetical protein